MKQQKYSKLSLRIKIKSVLITLSLVSVFTFLSCEETKRNFEHPETLAEALFNDMKKIENHEDIEKIRDIYFPDKTETMGLMTLTGSGGNVDEILDRWTYEIKGGIREWLTKISEGQEYYELIRKKEKELFEISTKMSDEHQWDMLAKYGAERYNKQSIKEVFSNEKIKKQFEEEMEKNKKKNKEFEDTLRKDRENKLMDYIINLFHQKIINAKYVGFERGKGKSNKDKHPRISRSTLKISIDDKNYDLVIDNMDKILESWRITDWD